MTAATMRAKTSGVQAEVQYDNLPRSNRLQRTNVCDFKGASPFVFRANANAENVAWTPDLLRKRLGVKDFGNLAQVHVTVTGDNDEDVCSLASWWTAYNYPVEIKFPSMRYQPTLDGFCFGVCVASAFQLIDGFWEATAELVSKVRQFFSDNRLVSVA